MIRREFGRRQCHRPEGGLPWSDGHRVRDSDQRDGRNEATEKEHRVVVRKCSSHHHGDRRADEGTHLKASLASYRLLGFGFIALDIGNP